MIENSTKPNVDEGIPLSNFLESALPGKHEKVKDYLDYKGDFLFRDIKLYCNSDQCAEHGKLTFRVKEHSRFNLKGYNNQESIFTVQYRCVNCQNGEKVYCFIFVHGEEAAIKVGEAPPITKERVSKKLFRMLEKDEREYFRKAMISETMGHGLAAFTYYRRIVESMKNRLFDQIISVAKMVDGDKYSDMITALDNAKKQPQFFSAIQDWKATFPEALLLSGKNPLTLLHGALSNGLHNGTEDECLELAGEIRAILSELTRKIADALQENEAIKSAIARVEMAGSKPKKIAANSGTGKEKPPAEAGDLK